MEKKLKIIPIFIPHEGCTHSCIFCNQKEITGCYEQILPGHIEHKIDAYLRTLDTESIIVEVAFFGGSFTALPLKRQEELLKAVQPYLNKGLIDSIRVSTRPDYIDREKLKLLENYRVNTIELGVQSMDNDVLAAAKRGHTSFHTIEAVKLIREHGFALGIQIMVGLPRDTEQKTLQTAQIICELKPDFVRIYPVLVIRGTELERAYLEGSFRPLTLEQAVELCAKVCLRFVQERITVIRIGLQTTEEIREGGQVVAGPFHPAIGEMVAERIYWYLWQNLLKVIPEEARLIQVSINPKEYSKVIGHKRNNLDKLKKIRPHSSFCLLDNQQVPVYFLRLEKIDDKSYLQDFSVMDLSI